MSEVLKDPVAKVLGLLVEEPVRQIGLGEVYFVL